ncbi:DEAD/DEAH box helicase family protein [Candidatus Marinimicrobia bacterium]|nr:DEAD/DEAH box helicase family protein [Candidatus Neomarinimicrobiota bacterium]
MSNDTSWIRNEQETRTNLILPKLDEAGWRKEGSRIREEVPISIGRLMGHNNQRATKLDADYVLEYKNTQLAVVEAKKTSKSYTAGVSQAKNYAKKLNIRFTYATNGKKIYQIDMETGKEGDVDSYPTPEELWEMTYGSEQALTPNVTNWREKFGAVPFENRGGTWTPRYYQQIAIDRTLEAISQGKKRILLTLATGTGKTAIAFQIAWKLFKQRWTIHEDSKRLPRTLFLADRNILADQAYNAFSSAFADDALVRIKPDSIRKKSKVPTNGSVFFTIFQTFMSGDNDTPYFGEYPRDFFDFIVIDECHRGGARDESNWRAIMNYFDSAVQLGLTATPKRTDNIDTYAYFGEPVYTYSLKDGINDGYLTPFKVQQIHTNIDEYVHTGENTVVEGEVEEGKLYTQFDFNRSVEIREREEFRIEQFLKEMKPTEKTIIFCATQDHAAVVRDIINQQNPNPHPDFCHRVTADEGELGEQHLRNFQDNEKVYPAVLTTSQKLSTGVDCPELRNIVLMRPVNSMIEFKQIIGRGTRLFQDKNYFTVYDFEGAYKHFLDPEWDGEPLDPDEGSSISPRDPVIIDKEPKSPDEDAPKEKLRIELSKDNVRELQAVKQTSFWDSEGKPISAEQFVKLLFNDLPQIFKSEDELRAIWSRPDTRKQLLIRLNEHGYSEAQLEDLRTLIKAIDSDIFDVLAFVAFNTEPVSRDYRATKAKEQFAYENKQLTFINFILDQYVDLGFKELDNEKLPKLITLKYQSLNKAKQELGDVKDIRDLFIDFQRYLYLN